MRRSLLVVMAAILLAGCSQQERRPAEWLSGRPTVSAPAAAPMILGVTYHPTWSEMPDERRAMVLDRLQTAGVEWLRIDVSWAEFQPDAPDVFDNAAVAAFDQRIDEVRARGFKVLLMFYWAPAWATGSVASNARPEDPAAFGRAAAWLTTHLQGRIDALEVWNEPDTDRFWEASPERTRVSDFAELLLATSYAVRTASPGLPLIIGGSSRVEVAWWQELLRTPGLAQDYTALAVHPYTVPSDLGPRAPDNGKPWRVRHLRQLMAALKKMGLGSYPVWVTEYGWSTSPNGPDTAFYERGVTPQQQAAYLLRALEEFAKYPQIQAAFWYTDIDHQTPDPFQNGFGLLEQDGRPKPSYFALACAASGVCGPSPSVG